MPQRTQLDTVALATGPGADAARGVLWSTAPQLTHIGLTDGYANHSDTSLLCI